MTNNNEDFRKVHLNKPQLRFRLAKSAVNVLIWGRGTGKSDGPISDFTIENVHAMPRGNGGFINTTYEQALTRTLPGLTKGLERLGYYEGYHYFIGKYAPTAYGWKKAFVKPIRSKNYIHWYNGSGQYILSQDRPGLSNGLSIDWLAGDEAKFLNPKKLYEETFPTVRGNASYFGNMWQHGSMLFTTDMPTNSQGGWLFEYEKQCDKEKIQLILKTSMYVEQLRYELYTAPKYKAAKIQKRLEHFEAELNKLKTDTVLFDMATTLDNVEVLGLKAIRKFRRVLPANEYNMSVLSIRQTQVENAFYSSLDEDRHTYHGIDYDYVEKQHAERFAYKNHNEAREIRESFTYESDCRRDADLNLYEPIDISPDYNNKINTLVVGQQQRDAYKIINALYVTRPKLLHHLVEKFCHYYRHHQSKIVYYYYDQTAIGKTASKEISFAEEYKQLLRAKGWTVVDRFIGGAPTHKSRHMLWNNLLEGKDARFPPLLFNKDNCKDLLISMQNAGTKATYNDFKKDKSSEHENSGISPEHATHFSEAADILIHGKFVKKFTNTGHFVDLSQL